MNRRTFFLLPLVIAARDGIAEVAYGQVERGVPLRFPRDHGSHPDFHTEWWYVTGLLRESAGAEFGAQITFFRSRPGVADHGQSRFTPRQLLFAHVALALPGNARLLHDQRAARVGLGLAEAGEATTGVHIDNWSLGRSDTAYFADIAARDFSLRLVFRVTQPPLLQGDAGVSRKGPGSTQASFYYSVPQLAVTGTATIEQRVRPVTGIAWLDHEWSSQYLAQDARGWDWTGINFDDGGALMAFRIRDRDGNPYWAGGSYRDAAGRVTIFTPADVHFVPIRRWRSPRTNIDYPVAFRVAAGELEIVLEPLFDDQELDARASVGTIYWEGAVHARRGGQEVGRGYLELTGYGAPLKI